MTLKEFLSDRLGRLVLQPVSMAVMAVFLLATGTQAGILIIILIVWFLLFLILQAYDFLKLRSHLDELKSIMDGLDQKHLFSECVPTPHNAYERRIYQLMRRSGKAMIEAVSDARCAQRDYREYIESWVHEIKAPITGISLMCENHRDELTRRISLENQKIENYVDMALYYARSEEVYKDYVIQETDLQEVAREVLAKNKHYLIQNGIQAEVDCRHRAFTDQKWISFILNQLVLNATKYKGDSNACIKVETQEYAHGVRLLVSDNGIGIKEEELGRIYDKGFTGSNGRTHERSTGMGLYLCRKLCGRLGIDISARSREGAGTQIILEFPVSSYLSKL